MNELLQTLSHWSVFIGIILTGLGGLGAYHFGKLVDSKKEADHQKELNEKLEAQRKDLVGYSLGHESRAFFMPMIPEPLKLTLNLKTESKYPVFDIYADWVDVDKKVDLEKGKLWTRNRKALGDLYPNKMLLKVLSFDFAKRDSLNINIWFQYRNGSGLQSLRVRKVRNKLKIAFWNRSLSGDYEEVSVPPDFPGYDPDSDPKSVFEGM